MRLRLAKSAWRCSASCSCAAISFNRFSVNSRRARARERYRTRLNSFTRLIRRFTTAAPNTGFSLLKRMRTTPVPWFTWTSMRFLSFSRVLLRAKAGGLSLYPNHTIGVTRSESRPVGIDDCASESSTVRLVTRSP